MRKPDFSCAGNCTADQELVRKNIINEVRTFIDVIDKNKVNQSLYPQTCSEGCFHFDHWE